MKEEKIKKNDNELQIHGKEYPNKTYKLFIKFLFIIHHYKF